MDKIDKLEAEKKELLADLRKIIEEISLAISFEHTNYGTRGCIAKIDNVLKKHGGQDG